MGLGMAGRAVLVAADPGLRELGLAVFEGGRLVKTFLVRNPEKKLRGPKAWKSMLNAMESKLGEWPNYTFVSECMQIDGRSRKIDVRDLLETQAIAASSFGYFEGDIAYTPADWKGGVPKAIHQPRILVALTPDETKVLEATVGPKSKLHNVIDSVGIGLFHLGRLSK